MDLKIEIKDGKMCIEVENYERPANQEPGYNADSFYNAALQAVIDAGYEINGYEREMLYIKDDDKIYDGTFVTNACFWNAFIELYETGKTSLGALDDDLFDEYVSDWFN